MNKGVLAAAALAAALSAAAGDASAMSVTRPLGAATPVQKAGVYCGLFGCGPISPVPRRWEQGWGPWGYPYRPACPIDYYYSCRHGPLGYGQCACWPYPGH